MIIYVILFGYNVNGTQNIIYLDIFQEYYQPHGMSLIF
jgi:hypothetical protein